MTGRRPIEFAVARVGLHLFLDRGCTGREVQRAHMALARAGKEWSRFALPPKRGALTVTDVQQVPARPERNVAIEAWRAVVCAAWAASRGAVRAAGGAARVDMSDSAVGPGCRAGYHSECRATAPA